MNTQLIESLLRTIASLTPEEQAVLKSRLQTSVIQKTTGVCGGYARIRDTRIPVWTLVSLKQQGAEEEELLRNFPGLTPIDLEQAWVYYDRHQAEIDSTIAAHHEDGSDD